MRKVLVTTLLVTATVGSQAQVKNQSHGYPIDPVPFTSVKVTDSFWGQRLNASREVTIPLAFSKCEETGRYQNFVNAAHPSDTIKVGGLAFDDTDVYKTIEGASYLLQTYPDKKLAKYIDSVLVIVAAAQEPDGYLYTSRTMNPKHPHEWAGSKRWEKVEDLSHEFYNLGHMVEGAIAHYQATGKKNMEIRALIRELAQEHTVILSSHILSEVQEVCDHIFIIHHGRLVAQGTPAQLERELTGTPAITLLLKAAPEEGRVLLSGVPGVVEVAPLPCGEAGAALLRLTPAEGADPREAVFRACAGADLPILEMRRESLSLEQIFLELTSDASAAGQAGGRRRPFGRRDSAEPEPAPETAITEHGEEAEP